MKNIRIPGLEALSLARTRSIRNIDYILTVFLLLVVIVYGFIGHTYFFKLDILIAQSGFSVVEFTNSILFSENYVDNYPGGSSTVGKSIIVWFYPMMNKIFGISAFHFMHVMIFFEIISLILMLYIFIKTFLPNYSHPVFIILTVLSIASSARNIDLARFGQPFFIGQFYVFADVFRILALCAFFTRRYWSSLLFLCLGFMIHPSLTVLILPVFLGFTLVDRERFKERNLWLIGFGFVMFSILWSLFFINIGKVSITGFTDGQYFEYSKLLNYHWYLSELNLLIKRLDYTILPFLSFVIIGLESVRRTSLDVLLKKQLFVSTGIILLISFFGLMISVFEISPMLVKISPQRISAIAPLILLPFLIYRMVDDLKSGKFVQFLIAVAIINFIFSTSHSPYPILLSFLYASPAFIDFLKYKRRSVYEWSVIGFVILVAIIIILHWLSGYKKNYEIPLSFLIISSLGLFLYLFLNFYKKSREKVIYFSPVLSWILVFYCIFSGGRWLNKYRTLPTVSQQFGKHYLAAQLWAKDNTAKTDLFMPDPCQAYGWRDFSNRSSWGTYNEFLKTGWLYSSDYATFQEGLKRIKVMDLNLEKIHKKAKTVGQRSVAYCKQARKTYYGANSDWFKKISNDYGIDYFIFYKKYLKQKSFPSPTYENKKIMIIKASSFQ